MKHYPKLGARFPLRILSMACLALFVGTVLAQQPGPRAKPRTFSQAEVSSFFFDDVFAEALQGERPASLSENRQMIAGGAASSGGTPASGGDAASSQGDAAWDALISATTLQDEVKKVSNELQGILENIRRFNGGGYNDARRAYTELALLFHVIGNYRGEVRWKDNALLARDRFARAGSNLKTATDNTFKEAKDRAEDLATMLRGSSISGGDANPDATWETIADRPPLMQRLEIAFDGKIRIWTSNANEFQANSEELLHEAELIAAIAHAMQQEGFEYYDDEDYVGFTKQMRDAATAIAKAVRDNDAEGARTAAGEIAKSCSQCHEGYR
ncbi:MAG: cytochrome c [Pirellulaceae bacterium]